MGSNYLVLSEAKDKLVEVNNIINKTKETCWRLLAIMAAIDVFVLKEFQIKGKTDLISACALLCLISSCYIIYSLRFTLFPYKIGLNGTSPIDISDHTQDPTNALILSYSEKINASKLTLSKMSDGYQKSAICLGMLIFFLFAYTVCI